MNALYEISAEPIALAPLIAAVARRGDGGIASFLGVVRDTAADGALVTALEYQAYAVMAVPEIRAIVAEAERRFAARVLVVHRIGRVAVGETAVAVAASATHRDGAFAACRYAVDELKTRVPIWKRECYADGGGAWRENEPTIAAEP